MYNPYLPQLSKFDIFLQWLKELGGSYEVFRDDSPKKQHDPKGLPTQRPLNPKHYYTDKNGSIRKISDDGLELADRLGI
jgi:hypothetical protein